MGTMPNSYAHQRRAIAAMQRRWRVDLARLEKMHGRSTVEDCGPKSDMQRNLGTAICEAESWLAMTARNAVTPIDASERTDEAHPKTTSEKDSV